MKFLVRAVDTDDIDRQWGDLFPPSEDDLLRACSKLVFLVEARMAVQGQVQSPREVQERLKITEIMDRTRRRTVETGAWRISRVPTRFKLIGGELIPVAADGVRVTIRRP